MSTHANSGQRLEPVSQALLQLSNALWTTRDLDQYYAKIHEIFCRHLGAENFFIALADWKNDKLVFSYCRDEKDGVYQEIAGLKKTGRKSLSVMVIRSGQPLLIRKPEREQKRLSGELEPVGTAAEIWVGVPLKVGLEVIGLIAVQNYDNPNAFNESDIEFLVSASEHIAVAIERSRVETALRESLEKLEGVFRASPVGIGLVKERKIVDVNEAVSRLTGYTREELIGESVRKLYFSDEQFDIAGKELYVQIQKKGLGIIEADWRHKNGERRFALVTLAPMDRNNPSRGFAFTGLDLTERKKMEFQLRQSEKMSAIGQLAGGVAHDFNNLLQVINGFIEAELDDAKDPGSRDRLSQVLEAGQRAAGLVRQLLAFSRQQVLKMGHVDLNEVIENLLKMIRRVIGEHIELSFFSGQVEGEVRADADQVTQVILNLCINARDAMPGGGQLTLHTEMVHLTSAFCVDHPWARPGKYVRIGIEDTGIGMDKEILGQIFEPFFTTKAVGQGTGLGLATVYGIVNQHDGLMAVTSAPGRGSRFDIYFPLVSEGDVSLENKPQIDPISGGTETILLVEDEDLVRKLTKSFLEEVGYKVVCARDGLEAWQLFVDQARAIDLVLTDVVMPRLGGRGLYDRIRDVHPNFPVLFSSGYSFEEVLANLGTDQEFVLIQKPFERRDLLHRVREALNRKP